MPRPSERGKQPSRRSTGGKPPSKSLLAKAARRVPDRQRKILVKKRRSKPGTVALREIGRFQQTHELVIPKAPFQRLVREITQDIKLDIRWQPGAIAALQEAAENWIVATMSSANLSAVCSRRVTVLQRDMHLVFDILNMMNPLPWASHLGSRGNGLMPGRMHG